LTVITLVAETTVEATLGFPNAQTGTNLKIYFCEGLDTFFTQKAGLADHWGEMEIIRI